jgi:hypothetical protein
VQPSENLDHSRRRSQKPNSDFGSRPALQMGDGPLRSSRKQWAN